MEKEILFSLKGLQMSQEDQEELETIMAAEYYLRNDHHYIVYDEVMEGFEEATKNIFKFDGSCLEVTKRGAVNVHMLFEEQKKNMTTYHTPFGDILIGIDTEKRKRTKSMFMWIIRLKPITSIWRTVRLI